MDNIKLLRQEIEKKAWFHAYLFVGEDEYTNSAIDLLVGARKAIASDVSVIESTSENGKKGEIKVLQARNLLHDINLSPLGPLRVGIIKGSDQLNYACKYFAKSAGGAAGRGLFYPYIENSEYHAYHLFQVQSL